MANKKKETIDQHLLHIVKNTTPFERMVWLKKNIDFFKKMQAEKHNLRATKRNKI